MNILFFVPFFSLNRNNVRSIREQVTLADEKWKEQLETLQSENKDLQDYVNEITTWKEQAEAEFAKVQHERDQTETLQSENKDLQDYVNEITTWKEQAEAEFAKVQHERDEKERRIEELILQNTNLLSSNARAMREETSNAGQKYKDKYSNALNQVDALRAEKTTVQEELALALEQTKTLKVEHEELKQECESKGGLSSFFRMA
jgi:chromosome segregation ATPase